MVPHVASDERPAKMHRILNLYDHPPDDGRVIDVDEFWLLT
ncbi:hypothetical protein C8D88_12380 [Lentzea atacamensis]|uniref:Uncharacterized protein n=1 Tax=Lentzea atacamensis TaxID=531938 RepID=A0A316HJR3_9PSEU|nr:hypothetical protein [Lentzea atacamensis]PWK80716.1 hypothetical protein C8D88_12380 [Lentzea atacamensis]